MTIWRLVQKEIAHRRLGAAISVLAVSVAVGVLVSQVGLLRAHDLKTEQVLAAKQHEADRELANMEDAYRKYMKELGFNVLILAEEQDVAEFWREGHATCTIPEATVNRLAATGITVIRHLLPMIQQRILWPEKQRTITLIGTRGEVAIVGRSQKEPMLQAVPSGRAVLGHQLGTDLALSPGDTIVLRGSELEVLDIRPRRGGIEDATVWISLADAQRMLGLAGRISAIEALKCHCASVDQHTIQEEIAVLKKAITGAVPGVQVVIRENRVVVRAKARQKARQVHEASLRRWQAHRAELRGQREALAGLVVPLVILGAAVWIAVNALANVRERRTEIGILRAIGVSESQVFVLFIAKALLLGVLGAILGVLGGGAAALAMAADVAATAPLALLSPSVAIGACVGAPLLGALAGLAPAVIAARHDPAVILSEV